MREHERERSQLVISLGEGPEGQRRREAIDRAATKANKTVSTWAREALLALLAQEGDEHDSGSETKAKGKRTKR
jgi:hypothetical protein